MIRKKSDNDVPPDVSANDNTPNKKVIPFNDKDWRREYMRRYMRERRLKKALEAARK